MLNAITNVLGERAAYWAAAGIVVLILLFLARIFWRPKDRYEAKRLLTANEEEFFGRLLEALPDYFVFPQVAFRAFLRPGAKSDQKAYGRQLGRIGAKHCDFLICNRDLDILAIVELDDRTHVTEKDQARDAITGSAGITTIRYESRQKPSPEEICDDFRHLCSPAR